MAAVNIIAPIFLTSTAFAEDGVAAFSTICYYFPIIFMMLNSMSQSAQPIISYNMGVGAHQRVRKAFHLTIIYAVVFAACVIVGINFCAPAMVGIFLKSGTPAYNFAVEGMPYFSFGYIFLAINMMYMGYYQSIERYKIANIIAFIRGFVLLPVCFIVVPMICRTGVWFAVPLVELLTVIVLFGVKFWATPKYNPS